MNARSRVRVVSLLAYCVVSLTGAGSAAAYCRSTTEQTKDDTCFVCPRAGLALAWSEPSIDYHFREPGFPELSATEVRDIFAQAFDRWTSVTCQAKALELDVQALPDTSTLGPRKESVSPTISVMGYLSAAEWSEHDLEPHAFATTKVRFYKGSGVIVGADIWFNGGIGDFSICPETGCDISGRVDLPNVATHEIGHFLGLEHSPELGATMACEADRADVDLRSLEQDDRDGLCAIYPPGIAFRGAYLQGAWTEPSSEPSAASKPRGCSVHADGPGETPLAGLLSGAVALALWRRRRPRRR